MKKEVTILGLSYSQSQSGSYVVVLSEKKGKRKLPIIIKPNDAQQIALKIENVKSPRPQTHDVFKSLTDSFDIDIQEIFIYTVLEGIFYTKLIASNGLDVVEIECTAGDGIVLSQIFDCPIYTSNEVLEISGIYINDDGTSTNESVEIEIVGEEEKPKKSKKSSKRVVSVEDLERMMNDAIANEEYEIAAELRDKIAKLKEKK